MDINNTESTNGDLLSVILPYLVEAVACDITLFRYSKALNAYELYYPCKYTLRLTRSYGFWNFQELLP